MHMLELMRMRRSRYQLSDSIPLSEKDIKQIIQGCMLQAPSAFNSQSARVVLLLKNAHAQLWHITEDTLRPLMPAEKFAQTAEKIASFAAAYGTILYFDDIHVIHSMQEKFPTYKENFPIWAQQANGMLQFAIWTALAEAGIGASLQHYNPLIDARLKETFGLPASWQLLAQMPFGTAHGADLDKTYLPLSQRFMVKQ